MDTAQEPYSYFRVVFISVKRLPRKVTFGILAPRGLHIMCRNV
jgi:hypothetical protein